MGETLYTYICQYEGLVLFQVFPHLSIKEHTHKFKRALLQVQKMYKAILSVLLFQVPGFSCYYAHTGCTSATQVAIKTQVFANINTHIAV